MKTAVPVTNLVIIAAIHKNGMEIDLTAPPIDRGEEIIHSVAHTKITATKIDVIEGGIRVVNSMIM